MTQTLGKYELNRVTEGDCSQLVRELPLASIDIIVTSPPYWGQRITSGSGDEEDPREYLDFLTEMFASLLPKLKSTAIVWINLGDAYNTPVNWSSEDRKYSSLGPEKIGLSERNSAYVKPRAKRRAFTDRSVAWLRYGNLLALPYRLVLNLCDAGYLFRGEVVWRKRNPMPEGKCRRPHRQHEPVYLMSKTEKHCFRTSPSVKSVWEFANEKIDGQPHYSRFPEELPRRCIDAYGHCSQDVIVLDPFSGSGTTGIAAIKLGCSFVGFEIDSIHVKAANARLAKVEREDIPLFTYTEKSSTNHLRIGKTHHRDY